MPSARIGAGLSSTRTSIVEEKVAGKRYSGSVVNGGERAEGAEISQGTRRCEDFRNGSDKENGMQYNETTLDSRSCSCLLALHSGLRLPNIIYSLVVAHTKTQQKIPMPFIVNKSIIASSIAVPPYLLNPSHRLHPPHLSPFPSPTHLERLRLPYLARPHAAP